jgi:pimeloyl-ACP methyl ester carboxylesterase
MIRALNTAYNIPMRLRNFLLFLAFLLFLIACNRLTATPSPPTATLQPTSAANRFAQFNSRPCPDSDFTCITLSVPLDHFDSANTQTTKVVFAILPATGERKGMFVTATGGPGTSGLAAADSYTAAFDPAIPEHFDIVFFDQRGVGASGGFQCAEAVAALYQSDSRADTPEQEAALTESAQTFAEACVDEIGSPDPLRFFSTRQAVEDLESFRQAIGDEKFWFYGESYGTQFAQIYAAAHADHLAGLILDGTVDLTLSGPDYLKEQAQAFNEVLVETLDACNEGDACATDVGGDALAAYDGLAASLRESPLSFNFPRPSGAAAREFTLADLEVVAVNALYAEASRSAFLRALAASTRGDLTPLARLLYDALGLDPETLEAIPDPTYSDAVYYAVECNDYEDYAGAPDQRAESYLRAGDEVDESPLRLSSVFYGDLPCAFWPNDEALVERPAPLVADGVPVLVLAATADPATPYTNSQRVYRRLANGYLITKQGGPHVIFGRGDACVDDIVIAFLAEDKLPDQRETVCPGEVIVGYDPLTPVDAADFANPLEALSAVETEINYLPEYNSWDGETRISVGCPFGGTLTFESGGQLAFDDCAFAKGFVLAGNGEADYEAERFKMGVLVTGLADGELTYERDGDSVSVTGFYHGQAIELTK